MTAAQILERVQSRGYCLLQRIVADEMIVTARGVPVAMTPLRC